MVKSKTKSSKKSSKRSVRGVYQKGLQCENCLQEIFSDYTHDFKYCFCQNIFVDGGFDYMRYGWEDGAKFKFVVRELKCRVCDNGISKEDTSKFKCNTCYAEKCL